MKKIISLYQRNYDGDHCVRDEVTPGAEWVLAGEGRATRKWDGTACLVEGGKLFKRYHGKTQPPGFVAAQAVADPVTGHWPGWLPVSPDDPSDRWHREAFAEYGGDPGPDGTYELAGPKINGNPEELSRHVLIAHVGAGGSSFAAHAPRTFDAIREWLARGDVEGIVWHHPDGRMAKIKKRDFGLSRKPGATPTSDRVRGKR